MAKYIINWVNRQGKDKSWHTDSMIDAACKYIAQANRGWYVSATKDGQLYKINTVDDCLIQQDNIQQYDDVMFDGQMVEDMIMSVKYQLAYLDENNQKHVQVFDDLPYVEKLYELCVRKKFSVYMQKSINDGPWSMVKMDLVNKEV